MNYKNISILGSGAISTAFGNILAKKDNLNVQLVTIEDDVVESINKSHINKKYFPSITLTPNLSATSDLSPLKNADIIFIGIPSVSVINYLKEIKTYLSDNVILVNLAKGFGENFQTIPKSISQTLDLEVVPMKGPSFAREMLNNTPTAFTVASKNAEILTNIETLFNETTILIDKTDDIEGVEYLSILKNIYAIVIGIVDAQFASANLRFAIFTKAFNEMRNILKILGGKKETMFNYCGIGDFGLTSLNDLSRNRTLGLLIGKGFFDETISNKVVLEGRVAMNILLDYLKTSNIDTSKFPLLIALNDIFEAKISVSNFVKNVLS